jgi:putative Holliday junction resolvase
VSLGVPITTYDERLTTVTADRSLRGIDLDGYQRRKVIDQVAAAVMLQAWVDAQPEHSTSDGDTPAERRRHE